MQDPEIDLTFADDGRTSLLCIPTTRRSVAPRRVAAYGLRKPFRFTIRPGTNDLWIGDVGWGRTEEIDRVPDPTAASVANFGWPRYEGAALTGGKRGSWRAASPPSLPLKE